MLPEFESVAVVNKGATGELKARFGMPEEDPGLEINAGTGAVVGAHTAYAACGAYALLCALYTVPAGTVIGAVAGGLSDWVAGSQNKSAERQRQLLALDGLFVEISRERTINREIETNLKRKIPAGRILDNSEAAALLQFRLYDIRFTDIDSHNYALTLKTVMLFKWNREWRPPSTTSNTYEFTSRALPLEDWIQDEGRILNQALDSCMEGLTELMVEDIKFSRL